MAVTWNPADKNTDLVLSGGNLTVTITAGGSFEGVRATQGYSTGAHYFEIVLSVLGASGDNLVVGIADLTTAQPISFPGGFANSAGDRRTFNVTNGFVTDVGTLDGGSYVAGDVYMLAVDATNGKIWRGVNGTWLGGVTPVVGAATQWAHWTPPVTVYPTAALNFAGAPPTAVGRFLASSFGFAAPSGFSAWDPGAVVTTVFRRTLSALGTRTGSRQSVGV